MAEVFGGIDPSKGKQSTRQMRETARSRATAAAKLRAKEERARSPGILGTGMARHAADLLKSLKDRANRVFTSI